jgi:voltage-gated potassium channel
MTENTAPGAGRAAMPSFRMAAWGVLRIIASAAALVTLYYQLPLDRSPTWAAVTLSVGLVLFIALVGLQARSIVRSPFPGLRAIEALATSVPLFLLLFASTYYVMARSSASNFTAPLTRTDALYFTVTVFSTVGFGDITARSETARLVVTGQMIADLIVLGLGIKIIIGAVKRKKAGNE